MSVSRELLSPDSQTAEEGSSTTLDPAVSQLLKRGFGTDFSVLDGASGELLHAAADQPTLDWGLRAELCRQVARRNRPEFIDDEDPFLVLALPLESPDGTSRVAASMFVSRPIGIDEDIAQSAANLHLDWARASDWARCQTPWPADVLQRMGTLVLEQETSRQRVLEMEEEAESLSVHLASTYEEISLLYRLTQNLKLSMSDADLARVALEWLEEVLPAKGMAIQIVPLDADEGMSGQDAKSKEMLLSFGQCPVDNEQFNQLIDRLGLRGANRPLVANLAITKEDSWPCPEVRQMIAVPLSEGENVFGHLAAFNHRDDGEFGTVEASLLSSVGAILGIHSGNIELYRQQSELLAGIIRALSSAIDAKDPYTCGHSDRVARVAVRLARELGCDDKMIDTLYLSGLLHDIGKIGIDDNVLRKPGKLTDEEYEHIKRHVDIGHKILMDLKKLDEVLPVVLHHHESWDGGGYPHQLPAEEIPLSARIVAVADAFDAMSSDRPYRKGMPDEKIDGIFRAGAGKQWDPQVVEAFFAARDDIRQIANGEHDDTEFSPFKAES